MEEPALKRAVAFFDGQNLYRHAKDAFGHHHPNYDPIKLTTAVCENKGWQNCGVRFYTGTPAFTKSEMWHGYWSNRLLVMRRAGIFVAGRPIRYRTETFICDHGGVHKFDVPQEKGIDVRLALDVIRLTLANQLDVALIFSQDQDLSEIIPDVREIASSQSRWIKVACAFPVSATASAHRGIAGADWIKIDQALYDSCLDERDYRPKPYRP